MTMATLLVVDDEPNQRQLYARRLQRMGYKVLSAAGGEEALRLLAENAIEVLVTDFQMPGMDGCEIISRARQSQPLLQSIVVTGYSDIRSAINAMGVGAFNYLQKPIDFAELAIVIEKGLEKRRLLLEVETKQRQLEEYRDQLEELVEKRTAALSEANLRLQEEIEERRVLEQSLREAKVQAENANRAKSEFLANMSHEIRTPMTSAIGLLNLVLDTELTPKQKAYLEMARVSTVVMHNLLSDILDLSKIEAGKLHLERIRFQPAKVVESVIDLQHFQAAEKGIKLYATLSEGVPEAVVGDPNRLRQILLNLVANALKFTQFGEVVIDCRRHPGEDAGKEPEGGELHFSVRDTGIGIEADKVDLIFQAFTQADSSTTRRFGGVGLGLNICSKLVAMMGGRLWVESQPGQGSIFHFTCRFDPAPHEEKVEESPVTAVAGTGKTGMSGLVLVVEDDRTNQWVIREILEHDGYTVVNVADGHSALEECRQRSFDLMLLDLKLPGMDGYEVVRRLRQWEKAAEIAEELRLPVIALTGMATEGEKERCLQAGMDDFIAKPFAINQFIDKARRAIGASRGRRGQIHKRKAQPKPSQFIEERFNESEGLCRAGGDPKLLAERLRRFLDQAPSACRKLQRLVAGDVVPAAAEQEVYQFKDKAVEVGATLLADELFSLLTHIRKQRGAEELAGQVVAIARECQMFGEQAAVRRMLGETATAPPEKEGPR